MRRTQAWGAAAIAVAVAFGGFVAPSATAATSAASPVQVAAATTLPTSQDAANAAANLTLLNSARTARGLDPLTPHPVLAANAYMWSTTMALTDTFKHNPYRGSEIKSLSWRAGGENIAWFKGYATATAGTKFHTMWMDSQGHRENILRTYFTHVGVGIYTAPDGSTYGTQVFAAVDDPTLPTPSVTGFGGTTTGPAGATADVTVTSGAAGVLERLTASGWTATGVTVPAGSSVVRVPAPATVGATDVLRITLPATSTTTVSWSPALAITATVGPAPTATPTTEPSSSSSPSPSSSSSPSSSPSPSAAPTSAPKASRLVSSTWPTAARSVRLGKGVNATAKVRAGDWVLERRNPGSKTWVTVRSGKATGTTSLSLALKPTKAGTSTFRLRLPATASTSARTLTVKVTARRASTAKVTASRTVAKPGAKITLRTKVSSRARLEQSTGGKWRKVATVPAGSSKVTVRAGKAGTTVRYRVVVPRTTTVTGATSKTVKVVVKR